MFKRRNLMFQRVWLQGVIVGSTNDTYYLDDTTGVIGIKVLVKKDTAAPKLGRLVSITALNISGRCLLYGRWRSWSVTKWQDCYWSTEVCGPK